MTSNMERVQHSDSPKSELCSASEIVFPIDARGQHLFFTFLLILSFYSYDGAVFHNHPDSKNGHYSTTLANSNGSPLAVGDYNYEHSKAEIFNIETNTWTDIDDYPYHPE